VLTIETCTSVPAYEEQVSFNIMPNPANEYVRFSIDNLSSSHVEISLINMVGGMIGSKKYEVINGSVSGRFILVGLDQGIYYIRVVSDNLYDAKRLIKLK